jgi:uracil-DNA glycosylase family protein
MRDHGANKKAMPPPRAGLAGLERAARTCRACPLWKHASQTVFGEGSAKSRLVFVGEQPGESEDLAGFPFVGPAGHLLERAIAKAGLPRGEIYITNVVKHFKWEPRGERRLHAKPSAREIEACRPWLVSELAAIKPALIVCLGVTAAQAICDRVVRVSKERGRRVQTEFGIPALITVHPSSLLRIPREKDPDGAFALFVEDLKKAAL